MSEFIEPFSLPPKDYSRVSHIERYEWAVQRIKGKVVANAACGTNYGSELLKIPTRLVIGFDRNDSALGIARDRDRLFHIKRDIQDETFDGFDTLVSLETIEHLVDPYAFLENLSTTIKELVISVPIIPTVGSNEFHLHDFTDEGIQKTITDLGWTIQDKMYQEDNGRVIYIELYATR